MEELKFDYCFVLFGYVMEVFYVRYDYCVVLVDDFCVYKVVKSFGISDLK